jgi:hypothetical protein
MLSIPRATKLQLQTRSWDFAPFAKPCSCHSQRRRIWPLPLFYVVKHPSISLLQWIAVTLGIESLGEWLCSVLEGSMAQAFAFNYLEKLCYCLEPGSVTNKKGLCTFQC